VRYCFYCPYLGDLVHYESSESSYAPPASSSVYDTYGLALLSLRDECPVRVLKASRASTIVAQSARTPRFGLGTPVCPLKLRIAFPLSPFFFSSICATSPFVVEPSQRAVNTSEGRTYCLHFSLLCLNAVVVSHHISPSPLDLVSSRTHSRAYPKPRYIWLPQ
jgi:hypothetical protein